MHVKTIYVFGNEYLSYDSMAASVAKHLHGVNVVHCRSPEELLEAPEEELLILDVVKGAKRPLLIRDISTLKSRNLTSLHDFDLGYFLKMADEIGVGKSVRIIGVPSEGEAEQLASEIENWIE